MSTPSNYYHMHAMLVDHTHADPRKPGEGGSSAAAGPIGQYGVPATYERSFKWKVGHFRNLCAVSYTVQSILYFCC